MQEYNIKKGHLKNIEGEKLSQLMIEIFGNVKHDETNSKFSSSFGALEQLTTWLKGKDVLCVETRMKGDVDSETAMKTIKTYNLFLERATGFTFKERKKMLTKAKKI